MTRLDLILGSRGGYKPRAARPLTLRSCTVKQAQAWVKQHHRHLKKLGGARWAVAVHDADTDECLGVAVVTNGPAAWEGTHKANLARVAVIDGVPNACSMLYGAVCRAAKALGYSEVWTYTLEDEQGTSLRAAGFTFRGYTSGGSHSRVGRERSDPEQGGPKGRWCRELC